jgi:hypothetical protein
LTTVWVNGQSREAYLFLPCVYSIEGIFDLKTRVFFTGLILAFLLFSGLAYAQSVQPAGGLDYLLYITFIIMLMTFVLAFINFRNINFERKLLEEERKELIRQREEWEVSQCKKIDDFQKEEKKDIAAEEVKLEKNLAAVEVYLKELEELKKGRKEDITQIQSELLRIQAERQKIIEDESRIAEDKKKIEKDLRDIEGMWADVENAMKTLSSGKAKKK